jgi:hypothetical protein
MSIPRINNPVSEEFDAARRSLPFLRGISAYYGLTGTRAPSIIVLRQERLRRDQQFARTWREQLPGFPPPGAIAGGAPRGIPLIPLQQYPFCVRGTLSSCGTALLDDAFRHGRKTGRRAVTNSASIVNQVR